MATRRKRPKHLSKSVEAMRRYLGSVDLAPLHVQQRLHDRARKLVSAISLETGISEGNAWNQIELKARSEGVIKGTPGKDW
jgi:hypothetical protein